MLNHAARTSSTIATILLYAMLVTAISLLEAPEESIWIWVAGGVILWTMAGDLYIQHKGIYPPYTARIYKNKLDINWGFGYLYWAVWWPRFIGK